MLAVSLVVGGVWWAQDDEPAAASATAAPGAPADASGARQQGRVTGTGAHGGPPERFRVGAGAGGAERTPKAGGGAERTPGARTEAGGKRGEPPRAGGAGGARQGGPRPGHVARPTVRPPGARAGARAAQPRRPAPRPRTARRTPAPPSLRPLHRSRATGLAIPFLDIDAQVMALRLDRDRRLPAPPDDHPNLVGWYDEGPSPGEQGTAVAVGHLDTDTGPAVFAGLTELKPGRPVEVRRADGRTAVYTVDAIKKYEKKDFPDREVYGPRGRPELRLITCGGTYDRRTGYSGNVVVFAHLTKIREPGGTARTR